jgi:hypothetical protein
MRKGKFESLQEKLAKCLVEWDDNHKSQASKEVLIKSVTQALIVYVMGFFKLPMGLCDELTKMIISYWWGRKGKSKNTSVGMGQYAPSEILWWSCLSRYALI